MKEFTTKGNPLFKCWIGSKVYTKEYDTNLGMKGDVDYFMN